MNDVSRKERIKRTSKMRFRQIEWKKLILLAGIAGALFLSFTLSSIPGETTAKVVYSHPWMVHWISKYVSGDYRINYGGKIIENKEVTISDPSYSGGSMTYTASPNAKIVFPFVGAKVEWVGVTGTHGGVVTVSIDGNAVNRIDLYEPYSSNKVLYTSNDLGEGPHVLTLESSLDRNPLGEGNAIQVDYFQVWGPGSSMRVENDDPLVQYTNANAFYYYQFILRKIFHFLLFFIVTIGLMTIAAWARLRQSIGIIPILLIIWAVSDEVHQLFIAGRFASIWDVMIDTAGVIIGLLGFYAFKKRRTL